MRILKVVGLGLAAVLAVAGIRAVVDDGYTIDVVLPAATNLVPGSEVEIRGATAGKVDKLSVRDGKAVVTVALDDDYAPLKDGTTARVSYKALLGERILELQPPAEGAELADGALVEGTLDRVELDQVFAALDAPTRAALTSLVGRLSTTLDGNERDLQKTLQTTGPAVEALGEVIQAVGTDGPAIRNLVTRLAALTTTLAERDSEVGGTIRDLDTAAGTIGAHRQQLQQALQDLPETLRVARTTLAKVPGTVAAASPLLRDLRPGVEKLPQVSRQLAPVLTDLRPTIAQLRPTLASLRELLAYTPALLDGAGSVLPQADRVLTDLGPALGYLRPYTPELIGWLSNWGSASANFDARGRYLRAFITEGTTSPVTLPNVVPPGIERKLTRLPGENEGQPWTDAHGSAMQ
ncbi:MAG: mammalian cell entry protein [Nocardioides sp.]|jgi:phospholipid/cholesterol/gamma-HCH transport system substrate-binding protein|nr:mammalian cell entry protein [Nocardioides sp.]